VLLGPFLYIGVFDHRWPPTAISAAISGCKAIFALALALALGF
jgi:hypothetical protein